MRGGESQAGFHMPSSADLLVTKYYAWLLGSAGGGPTWPPGTPQLPPPETDREALLSRRHQHVANCPSCQTMLAVNQRVRLAATVSFSSSPFLSCFSCTCLFFCTDAPRLIQPGKQGSKSPTLIVGTAKHIAQPCSSARHFSALITGNSLLRGQA